MNKFLDLFMAHLEGLPNGSAPSIDHVIPLLSRLCGENIGRSNIASLFWQREYWPLFTLLGKLHVRLLYLPSRIPLLNMKIQANQGKRDGNWLGFTVCLLSGKGIHDMLVDKCRV